MRLTRRLGIIALVWLLTMSLSIAMYIGNLVNGDAQGAHRVAYDVAFAQEYALHQHLDAHDPCSGILAPECTPEVAALSPGTVAPWLRLYDEYHRDFWLDVGSEARGMLLVTGPLALAAGLAVGYLACYRGTKTTCE